jgi:hypothetical protein
MLKEQQMHSDEEPGEQGDVLWQNPVRFAPEVEPRVARIVRHKVTYTAGFDGRVSGGREDEIYVETFSRDARGRTRWCDATEYESVAILKAALASAHQVLDAHRDDEKRRRDAMTESLRTRCGSCPKDPGPLNIGPCILALGHDGPHQDRPLAGPGVLVELER